MQQASETYEDVPMEPEVYTPPEDPKKARLRDLERERAAKVGGGLWVGIREEGGGTVSIL